MMHIYIIETDAAADPRDSWCIEEHRGMGQVNLELRDDILLMNERPVTAYRAAPQLEGGMRGHDLRDHLATRRLLNANVLDYLLKHQDLIPRSWRGKRVYFWGTIYRDGGDYLCVRYMYWAGSCHRWYQSYGILGYFWSGRDAAAVFGE